MYRGFQIIGIARRFPIAMVSCTYNLSLFYLQYMINFFHHETYCIEYFKRMHLHHILRYIIRHVLSWFHKWSFLKKISIIIFKQHRKLSFREFLPDKIKSYSNIQSNSSQSEGFMKRYHNTTFKQTNIKTPKLTYHSLTENPSTL